MRRTATILAAAVLTAVAGIMTAGPALAHDEQPSASGHHIKTSPYVALGDSYSAAAGVLPQVPGAPATCSRSLKNYAHDIAKVTEPKLFTDVTCSGATTTDFFSPQPPGVAPQLDAVTKKTRFVTMTIGGNDGAAFATILSDCVTASLTSGTIFGNPCQQKDGSKFTDLVADVTYPNLVLALTAVREKAPQATVAILGYPHVMPETGDPACYAAMPISMGDVAYVNQWEQALNSAVEKAAAETGVHFIDMGPSSVGRDACQPVGRRWIEPFNGPINAAPVHPNIAGEAAMARQTLQQLGIDTHERDDHDSGSDTVDDEG